MTHITIRIGAVGDPVLFPELKPDSEGELIAVGILEQGMTSGNTSIMLFIEHPDGLTTLQLSARVFESLASAVRGAMQRFEGGRNVSHN